MHMVLALGATIASGATAAGGAVAAGGAAVASGAGAAFSGLGSMLGLTGATAAGGAAATTGLHAGVANAALAGAGTAAKTSTMLGWLKAGGNALGAFSMLSGGMADKRAADEASLQERIAARQEEIRGVQEGNDLLDSAIDTMSRQQLTFGAAGIDAFSGSAKRTTTRTLGKAEKGIRTSEGNTYLSALRRRQSAKALTKQGRGSLIAGLAGAGERGFSATVDMLNRG